MRVGYILCKRLCIARFAASTPCVKDSSVGIALFCLLRYEAFTFGRGAFFVNCLAVLNRAEWGRLGATGAAGNKLETFA
jgi:hypothetical protein